MKVAFKNSFYKAIKKLKDVTIQNAIFEVINQIEQAENLAEVKNIKN